MVDLFGIAIIGKHRKTRLSEIRKFAMINNNRLVLNYQAYFYQTLNSSIKDLKISIGLLNVLCWTEAQAREARA